MLLNLVVIVAQWLLATALGVIVLQLANRDVRDRLWPAAPAVGLAAAVVILTWTSLLVPTEVAAPVLVALIVVATIALFARRREARRRPGRAALLLLVATAAVAGPGVAAAVAPAARTGVGTVMATGNHDAFYYVSVAEWLRDNPATRVPALTRSPAVGDDPPATGPAYSALRAGLRLGDTLLSASAAALTGVPVSRFWTWQVAGWLLVVPASLVGVARLLDRRRVVADLAGLAAGGVVAASSLVVAQVYNQNSASILGLALVPLALAAWWATLRPPAGRAPLWLAALLLAATLGSYSEYAPILVLAFGIAVLARPVPDLPSAIGRAAGTVLVAIVLAPAVFVRMVRSLLLQGDLANTEWVSRFHAGTASQITARLVGAVSPFDDRPSSGVGALAVVLILVIGAGLVLLVQTQPSRWVWLGFGAGALLTVWYLTAEVDNLYSQQRAVEISQPVVLGLAVLGWGLATVGRAEWRPSSPAVLWLVPLPAVSAVLLASNLRLVDELALPSPILEQRAVGDDFAEAAGWVARYGGDEGDQVSVAVVDYEDLMWLTDALREETEVSYVFLYEDYHRRNVYSERDLGRYVLAGAGTPIDAPPGALVERNDRFSLYDASSGQVDVVAPAAGFHTVEGPPEDPRFWMSARGEIAVARGDGGPARLTFQAQPLGDLGDVPLRITDESGKLVDHVVVPASGAPATVEIPLSDEPIERLRLESLDGARPPSGVPDPRLLSVYLSGFSVEPAASAAR